MKLTIAKVNEVLFEGDVQSVTCPGTAGELTVLAKHEPFITTLKEGTVVVRTDSNSEPQTFPIAHGILEVANNEAVVLL